jgi:hypothetical protein
MMIAGVKVIIKGGAIIMCNQGVVNFPNGPLKMNFPSPFASPKNCFCIFERVFMFFLSLLEQHIKMAPQNVCPKNDCFPLFTCQNCLSPLISPTRGNGVNRGGGVDIELPFFLACQFFSDKKIVGSSATVGSLKLIAPNMTILVTSLPGVY